MLNMHSIRELNKEGSGDSFTEEGKLNRFILYPFKMYIDFQNLGLKCFLRHVQTYCQWVCLHGRLSMLNNVEEKNISQ